MKAGNKVMRQSTFPLRLASSLQEEARKTAESEGISLNQLINLAVAEKISALRTEEFFRERGARANVKKARKILRRAGKEAPRAPLPGRLETRSKRLHVPVHFPDEWAEDRHGCDVLFVPMALAFIRGASLRAH